MGFKEEFKEFAMKGNVLDMAVGIIIGAEFGKIVNSLVNDVIMPPIGYVIGGVEFTKLVLQLGPNVTIKYGSFIQSVFNFIIIAFCIFMLIKGINSLKRKEPEAEKAA